MVLIKSKRFLQPLTAVLTVTVLSFFLFVSVPSWSSTSSIAGSQKNYVAESGKWKVLEENDDSDNNHLAGDIQPRNSAAKDATQLVESLPGKARKDVAAVVVAGLETKQNKNGHQKLSKKDLAQLRDNYFNSTKKQKSKIGM